MKEDKKGREREKTESMERLKGRENDFLRRLVRFLDRLLDLPLIMACLILLACSLYAAWDTAMIYRGASQKRYQAWSPLRDEEEAGKTPEEAVGWLWIRDTPVDYPVMQGQSNHEYINKNPLGEYALSGSIFLDFRNAPDFSDPYNVVYGHHMSYDAMFGCLDRYEDREYFTAHREGLLYTGGKVYTITIFSFASADQSDRLIFDPSSGSRELKASLEKCALIYEEPRSEHIIALSTCSADSEDKRTVVFGCLELKSERKDNEQKEQMEETCGAHRRDRDADVILLCTCYGADR